MNLNKLTVKARLMAAFGVLVAIVLLVSGLSLRSLGAAHNDLVEYVNQTSARGMLGDAVRGAAFARAVAARNLVLVTTPADSEAEKLAVTLAHQRVSEGLAKLKAATAGASEQERQLVAEIEGIESRYGPLAQNIGQLALAGKREEAIGKMNNECRPLLAALIKATTAYVDTLQTQAADDLKAADASYAANRLAMLAACAAAIGLAVVLALVITRGLSRALGAEPSQLGEAARRVAGGDLGPVAGAQAAPAGSVLASLGEMQASLARVVGQVRNASDSIATGSSQIATGNADLSQRTEEQASNLQQTAASMEQMTATVRNNEDTARQASQLATGASCVAEKGGQVVNQVVATMEDISASSRKISDIIGVIDGIAFQTNILALNAAVEAARAGEQGRGFAVVAGEVRTLAQRSAEAAREIKTLIGTSVEKVEAGSRLVGDAGTTMVDVVDQVKRVADLIGEISSATSEQTTGIGQVSTAVAQLDQVTQQNAALVEESAAAADSLQQQAQRLAEVVSVFKLGQDASAWSAPQHREGQRVAQ
jgi:methyl-accepting chemotaxis protein-1 (serine sensor receptor)